MPTQTLPSGFGRAPLAALILRAALGCGKKEAAPTFVPPPGCTVLATCVPRRADDVMK